MLPLSLPQENALSALWSCPDGAGVHEVRTQLLDPGLPYTTLASTLCQLVAKGYVHVRRLGRVDWFTPRITADEYSALRLTEVMEQYFHGSFPTVVALWVRQGRLSLAELQDLTVRLDTGSSPLDSLGTVN